MPDTNDYANIAASGDARAWAKQVADEAYNTSLASNASNTLALEKAKFAWQQVMDKSNLTGKFEDNWTMPSNKWFTEQFGEWMPQGPTAGQQTMTREQQTYNQQQGYGSMYGQYYAPGTAPGQGQQTLSAQDLAMRNAVAQAGQTGYYNAPGTTGQGTQTLQGQQQQFSQGLQTEQEARAAQAQQQTQTQAYLSLLSSLRGPADWAKYQQVLGSTPNGMRDLVGAAMGQYVPGGGATSGYQPQAASLQSMMGDVSGQPYSGQGGGQLQQPNVYYGGQGSYSQQQQGYAQPQQQQGQPQQFQVMPQAAGGGQFARGQTAQWQQASPQQQQNMYAQTATMPQQQGQVWGSGLGVGQQQPTPQQQQQGLGGGTNLPAPNQISAQGWKNMQPSQQQMLLGMYESQGWDKGDVQSLYNQSLPKYATNSPQAGTWKLQ